VAAYNSNTASELFWPGVDQAWSGDNINTDGALRSKITYNCPHANFIKAGKK
jgi:hypothetical protein